LFTFSSRVELTFWYKGTCLETDRLVYILNRDWTTLMYIRHSNNLLSSCLSCFIINYTSQLQSRGRSVSTNVMRKRSLAQIVLVIVFVLLLLVQGRNSFRLCKLCAKFVRKVDIDRNVFVRGGRHHVFRFAFIITLSLLCLF
jgi:hypothetical protein